MPPRDQLEGGSDTSCFTRVQYFVWDPGVPCRGAISSRTYPSCALPATGGGSVHVLTRVFHTLVQLKCACPLLFFTTAQVTTCYLQDTQDTHLCPHLAFVPLVFPIHLQRPPFPFCAQDFSVHLLPALVSSLLLGQVWIPGFYTKPLV